MKKAKLSRDGFTLIELMVAVALMLLLVGAVIRIFTISTEVCTRAEAQMSVYQNARAALALISKEAMCPIVKNDSGYEFVINNPPTIGSEFLRFVTSTSWLEDNGTKQVYGTGQIQYVLEKVDDKIVIKRRVLKEDNASTFSDTVSDSTLCEFLTKEDELKVEHLVFDSNTSKWNVKSTNFNENSNDKLPPAIKVTLKLYDQQKRLNRTIHRTIWIAPATGSGS